MSFEDNQDEMIEKVGKVASYLHEGPSQNPHELREQISKVVSIYAYTHELHRTAQLEGYQQHKKILGDYLNVIPQWLTSAQSILKSLENERKVSGL